MAIRGCNLDETRQFENKVKSIREKIIKDHKYKEKILNNDNEYEIIKGLFKEYISFLKYTSDVDISYLYRVRKLNNQDPYVKKSELLYPPASMDHKDRMNNISSRVLYVSLHEYTAMSETRINEEYLDKYFQITKFSANRSIKAFRLGQFSEIYKEFPRDSNYVNSKLESLFGSPDHDGTIRGYSALECAIADILYSQEDNYHILSSIMADAIFTSIPSVEAIIYPSVQSRYGTNLALNKELADSLEIRASFVNKLKDVYSNEFYKYETVKDCVGFDEDGTLKFNEVSCVWR